MLGCYYPYLKLWFSSSKIFTAKVYTQIEITSVAIIRSCSLLCVEKKLDRRYGDNQIDFSLLSRVGI